MGAKIAPKADKKEGEKTDEKMCEKKKPLRTERGSGNDRPAAEAGTLGLEFEEILS